MLGFGGPLAAHDIIAAAGTGTGLASVQLEAIQEIFVHSDLAINNVFSTKLGRPENVLCKMPV